MKSISASKYPYRICMANSEGGLVYPFFRNENGTNRMLLVSPQHGRSFIVDHVESNRWIVSKGNGLSYTSNSFITTSEQELDVWGLLLMNDAKRDFTLGNEISSLGIVTNKMEYVIELDLPLVVREREIKPVLLQYSVECPYRISDAQFMESHMIRSFVKTWAVNYNLDKHLPYYLQAAEVLISNLSILHGNGILHNAISSQNYTWALELVDFELASSPLHPYTEEDAQRHVPDLFQREILQSYQIILDIAGVLRENVSFECISNLFMKYGFYI
ncbi:MAG: hypothetical protein HDS06_03965 [Bacteroides sp.]|nr:hypothetical protein [Bacteroides sp.]